MAVDVEAYYRKYGPMVLRRCRSLLRDEARAQDAMHDVFVQLLRHEGRLEDRFPSSLLYTMATNLCISRIRSEKLRGGTEGEDVLNEIACVDDIEERHRARSLLNRIFSMESEANRAGTRAMAVMHLVDGMTFEQVGAAVGMSAIGVRKRLKKLKDRVRGLDGI